MIKRALVIFIRPSLNAYAPIITVRFSIINNISNVVGDDKTINTMNTILLLSIFQYYVRFTWVICVQEKKNRKH